MFLSLIKLSFVNKAYSTGIYQLFIFRQNKRRNVRNGVYLDFLKIFNKMKSVKKKHMGLHIVLCVLHDLTPEILNLHVI